MGLFVKGTEENRQFDARNVLAYFWSMFSAAYLVAITFHAIPPTNVRFADTILGFILGTLIATIVGWYFGAAKKDIPHED